MGHTLVKKNDILYIKGNNEPFTGIHIRHKSVGSLREKGHYLNGKKHGRWEYYTTAWTGVPQLSSIMHFKNGMRDGVSKHYSPNGNVAGYQYWKDDKYVPSSKR